MGEDVGGIPRPGGHTLISGLCLWGAKNIPVISRSKHVLATTLNDRGLGGDEVVGCQNLQTIAPQWHITPGEIWHWKSAGDIFDIRRELWGLVFFVTFVCKLIAIFSALLAQDQFQCWLMPLLRRREEQQKTNLNNRWSIIHIIQTNNWVWSWGDTNLSLRKKGKLVKKA